MKRIYLTSMVMAFMLAIANVTSVSAASYTESFDGISTSEHDFAPMGWGHIVDSYFYYDYDNWDSETYYVDYTANTTGGVDGGAYLLAGSQTLGPWGGDSEDVSDLLVSPKVSGEVSFYVKANSSWSAEVSLFSCTLDGTSLVAGEEIAFTMPDAFEDQDWVKVTLAVAEPTYIGFRLNHAAIDEFTAENVVIDEIKAMEITYFSIPNTELVVSPEDGTITLPFRYIITNKGNVTLEPGDENYSVTVMNYDEDDVVTLPITISLDPKEVSDTLTASVTFVPVDSRDRYDLREDISASKKTGSWVDAVPYVAKLTVYCKDISGWALETDDLIDYGVFKGTKSVEIEVKNQGVAPLTITGVNMPAGYSLTELSADAFPYVLQPDSLIVDVLTLEGIEGSAAGTISFVFEGEGNGTFNVGGIVVGENTYYQDFNDGLLPTGWLYDMDSDWSIAEASYQMPYDGQCLKSGSTDMTGVATPLLSFEEGEGVSFYACCVGKSTYNSSGELRVRYSTDRVNWTEALHAKTDNYSDASLDIPFYDESMKFFNAEIPAGNYYVQLVAGYVYVDDFVGGKVVDVDYDLMPALFSVKGNKVVNYPMTATFDVRNLLDKEIAADNYTVTLYANDEAIVTAATDVISGGATVSFEMTYTPHVAEEVTYYAEMVVNDEYTLTSEAVTVQIAEESLVATTTVGDITNDIYDEYSMPLNLYYKNSMSEVVYPAEVLNLAANSAITTIGYPIYRESGEDATEVTIWMENTTDEAATELSDTAAIAKVYSASYNWVNTSGSEFSPISFTLAESFIYTGGNIRIIIMSNDDSYKKTYFGMDDNYAVDVIYKANDNYDSFLAAGFTLKAEKMPVIYFGTELAPKAIAGTITNADGNAVAGATVTATSGDVMYATVTDEAGAYTLDVVQSSLEYTLTVSADGYVAYTHEDAVVMTGDVTTVDAVLTADMTTAIETATVATTEVMAAGNGSIVISTATAQKVAIYTVDGRMVANVMVTPGKTTLQGLAKGIYIVNHKKVAVR